MSLIQRIRCSLVLVLLSTFVWAAPPSSAQNKLLTVAESSGFTATSRYSDVLGFIKKLQRQSSLLRVETLCRSPEGREVPLLILGDPVPVSTHQVRSDGRIVVYIQANIHAGEVEGKEASLMLARDILMEKTPSYLQDVVLLIAPIFNADGNEQISPDNRRNQNGPERGVGVRHNGQHLDLNRDSMKLESPELQGLVANVLLRWDPVLLIDCHTTNGSYHEEPVTYSWPLNPNGDPALITYIRDEMMPAVQKRLQETYGTLAIPYGNFMDFRDPQKGWRTFGHQPRYVTNYIGLRNRLAVLNENYAYADFKTRVFGCYHFLLAILDHCSSNADRVRRLVREADLRTVQSGLNPTPEFTFAVEVDLKPLPDPVTVRGWEMQVLPREAGWPRVQKTEIKKTYRLPYYADFVPKRSIVMPAGYLIPVADATIIEKLLQHGLTVEKLSEPASLEVESFHITRITSAPNLYQGHRVNTIEGEYRLETRDFAAGVLYVGTDQPLAWLAAALLEAESDDGLLVWNLFDRHLVSQWRNQPRTHPVYRLLNPISLAKTVVR